MKRRIKITEGQIRRAVNQAIKSLIRESKGRVRRGRILRESEYETNCNLCAEDALRVVNLIKKDDAAFANAYDDMRNGYGSNFL